MERTVGAVLTILWFGVNTPAASAQQNHANSFTGAKRPVMLQLAQEPQAGMSAKDAMSMSGMMLGIVGMMGGAAVASGLKQEACQTSEDEGCLTRYAFTGALIASTALVPIGVHMANQNRKHLLTSMAASTLLGAALYFGMRAIPGEPVHIAPFIAAPVQMIMAIKIETK